jgi:hypothetical protein
MSIERARRIADAVLFEGYVLYPYRASARKNRYRWTFGVVAPRAWSEAGGCERSALRLECLVAGDGEPRVDGILRFLQVERRQVEARLADGSFAPVESLEVNGAQHITWEEGVAREQSFRLVLRDDEPHTLTAELAARRAHQLLVGAETIAGRVVRTQRRLTVALTAASSRVAAGLTQLAITVENMSACDDVTAPREEAVAAALVGAHLILTVHDGAFVSLLDPPPAARALALSCRNVGLFPVLAGEPGTRALLLASPIALYDHPEIAAESPGDSCDGTEIDELLLLSTRSLTDGEKAEARATDRRAAEVIDRAERLSAAALAQLHGRTQRAPFARGSRVRVRLGAATGARRSDAQDMFLDARIGVVEAVRQDVDGQTHVAVVLEDDPAADLHRWYGRHLYFRPEELELLEPSS